MKAARGTNYRSREMGEAFTIPEKAMLLTLIYPTTTLQIPAIPDRRKSPRLQMLPSDLPASVLNSTEIVNDEEGLRIILRLIKKQ